MCKADSFMWKANSFMFKANSFMCKAASLAQLYMRGKLRNTSIQGCTAKDVRARRRRTPTRCTHTFSAYLRFRTP